MNDMARIKLTPKLEKEILERIAAGESMRAICADAHMPERSTVLRKMDADQDFATRCARARIWQADALEEDMAEIERDTLTGVVEPKAASVVLSSKRWRAAKLAPKKYGDKITTEVTGANGGPVEISDTDRAAKVAALVAKAKMRQSTDESGSV